MKELSQSWGVGDGASLQVFISTESLDKHLSLL